MKLHLAPAGSLNLFTAYGEGYVEVNGQRYSHSLVVLPDGIVAEWNPESLAGLTPAHIEALAALEREVVLLGTGRQLRFPPPALLRPLIARGTGVEVMDIQAACRTYNILASEERKVAAALVFD